MVYLLKNRDTVHALVGTPEWVRAYRSRLMRALGKNLDGTQRRYGLMDKAVVVGMLDGGDAEAEGIRQRFLSANPAARLILGDLIVMRDEFDAWVAANTRPWDGSNAEALGVKGLGRPKPAPRPMPAASVGLGSRLTRRLGT